MNLEDGSFLMQHDTYDKLMKEKNYTKEQLDMLKIIRVNPKFRVIALCLPVCLFFLYFE